MGRADMDTLSITADVLLAVYDIAGVIFIAWAIWTACRLYRGRR
jgi:hypothetical protein